MHTPMPDVRRDVLSCAHGEKECTLPHLQRVLASWHNPPCRLCRGNSHSHAHGGREHTVLRQWGEARNSPGPAGKRDGISGPVGKLGQPAQASPRARERTHTHLGPRGEGTHSSMPVRRRNALSRAKGERECALLGPRGGLANRHKPLCQPGRGNAHSWEQGEKGATLQGPQGGLANWQQASPWAGGMEAPLLGLWVEGMQFSRPAVRLGLVSSVY